MLHAFHFACPHCTEPLEESATELFCSKNHHFDKASEGYVNLLLPNEKQTKDPGDSLEMVKARTQFLEKGYYDVLADSLADICLTQKKHHSPVIADIGCGEGYYSERIYTKLADAQTEPVMAGMDISRSAIRAAAMRTQDIAFAVASIKKLPFMDGSIDGLLNIFAPRSFTEFARVLKPEGYLMIVSPGPHHLTQLKTVLHLSEHEHEEPTFEEHELLRQVEQQRIQHTVTVGSSADLLNLCAMTPFWWKVAPEARQNVSAVESLTLTLDFLVTVFERV